MHEQDFGRSPLPGASRRLDSWKDIAEYLGRDVSTAMRWAKSHGMPVRRVAGGKGKSVFAFTHELDSWLAGFGAGGPARSLVQPIPASDPPPGPRHVLFATAATISAAIIAAGLFSLGWARSPDPRELRINPTTEGIAIVDADGASRVIHRFDPALMTRLVETTPAVLTAPNAGETPTALIGVAYYTDKATKLARTGELIHVDTDGNVIWRAPADYSLRFRDETFNGAFVISDWLASPASVSGERIAMASHHWMWWASPITVVDIGRAGPSFVNPGWMESLAWLDERLLVAGGFNNLRDAGAVTMLDIQRMHGQAPGTKGTEFECLACGSDAPVFYATLPRSELNRITGSRFNRARIELAGDRVIVTTIEIPAIAEPAIAVYDFSRDMQLLKARYAEAYWDWHRKLESEGRVTHTRENCPERDGPPAIHVWSQSGWQRTVAPR